MNCQVIKEVVANQMEIPVSSGPVILLKITL